VAQSAKTWTRRGRGERHDPLPSFLLLPRRGWDKLGRRGRIALVAIVAVAVATVAASWPSVQREREAGERERAREAAASRAAQRRAIVEDQRPRRATLPPGTRARIRAAGGLTDASAALLVGELLESAITRDARLRVRAGSLAGPVLETTCDPVRVRSKLGANYNCFVRTDSRRAVGRVYSSGYRFSARAQLPAGRLAWCKENPRPLHPTTYVISVPISSECR
jgi:hypothetical protein